MYRAVETRGPDHSAIAKILEMIGKNPQMLRETLSRYEQFVDNNHLRESAGDAVKAIEDTLSAAEYAEKIVKPLLAKIHDGTITDQDL